MSNEQAAVADLALLDAEDQRLCNQEANIAARRAEIKERVSLLRYYLVVEREYEGAKLKQKGDGSAPTTASTSDTSGGRTLTRRVTDMAVDLIRAKGRPIRTRDLLVQMEQQGLIVGGQNRVTNLSGILTRDKRLVVNRKLGWRLAEWGGDTPPAA